MIDPGASRADLMALADWRRRVAALYAEIRALPESRVSDAWDRWRATREALYREHVQSPVPAGERSSFRASHWPYDPALRFHVAVVTEEPGTGGPNESAPEAGTSAVPVSDGATMVFDRIGWVDIPFDDGARRLALYWMAGYAGGLFLPFRDATNGTDTYGAGRYLLDAAKSADLGMDDHGRLVLDFNFAYQPSCAFDPTWACPLAPSENWLDLPIRAGERIA